MNRLKTIINVTNLTKTIKSKREILKNINFKIYPGDLIGLLGYSGCGKSTLMNIIAGIDDQYKGELYIRGKLANSLNIYDRKIRFFNINTVLFSYLNIFENIKMGFRDDTKFNIDKQNKKVQDILIRLCMLDLSTLYPYMLSNGQQQKVKFARSIIDDPDIVLLDEPFDGLDEVNSEAIYGLICELNKVKKTSFIISSHDTYEILEITNRIVIMYDGVIVVDSDKHEILNLKNKYIWSYFNIGTTITSIVVKIHKTYIVCMFHDYEIKLEIKKLFIKLPKISDKIVLYIDPKSNIYKANSKNKYLFCILKKIVDFIFYYQNIFQYKNILLQINTINKLVIGKFYKIDLNVSRIDVLEN
jgi:ABC-type Fe3+/spermidine/putrescine transport system ATPase subunit